MPTRLSKPLIALAMGDVAGIGPELVIRAVHDTDLTSEADLVILGSPAALELAAGALEERAAVTPVDSVDEARGDATDIRVLDCDVQPQPQLRWGVEDSINGANEVAQIERAVELAVASQVDGVVIAPLNKEAMHLSGFEFPDEITFLGSLADMPVKTVVTWNGIYQTSATGHVPLRQVADLVTAERIIPAIKRLWDTMGDLGVASPRIGVAGLNPHAGEGGAFGDEEIRQIAPAIETAREMGIEVSGPHPADTIHTRARRGEFSGVVFMYHDQGNTALKSAAFGEGVLMYTGLPFPCAGPTHGSAYDIAGQGKADATSLTRAIELVCQMARGGLAAG